ncbi:MAG: alpha-glucosidase, partial [Bacteroidetes bacterium HGW-Bacteroidetes-22]
MKSMRLLSKPVVKWLIAAKLIVKVVLVWLFVQSDLWGQNVVTSPDKKLIVAVSVTDSVNLDVSFSQKQVNSLKIWFRSNNKELTHDLSPRKSTISAVNDTLVPVVSGRRSRIPDVYNEMDWPLSREFGICVRVYNDGWGYRLYTKFKEEQIINDEGFCLKAQPGDSAWFPEETSYLSHSERLYPHLAVNQIAKGRFCSLPALIHGQGIYTAVSEAWIENFPGLYIQGLGNNGFSTSHPPYPLVEKAKNDRTIVVAEAAPYIATTIGTRSFPWRVFGITANPGDLIGSDLVYRFGPPLRLSHTDWIKPGRVAWDWWNDNNISGVPFRAGINTDTYKYYIDFASEFGIEYIILDEGWSNPSDLSDINREMDMEALFSYAKEKKVGIILWVLFNTLDRQLGVALDQFQKWGAAGIKVDFMQRDDQKMVEYYWKIAREAASRKLLVDFHGSYKPDGIRRAFPNVLTREGVKGLENDKWGKDITPSHDLILPFTRQFAGPMDYTPGAMINATEKGFSPVWSKPMSQGTRCHQLALYVIYESPLQMLADNPTHYRKEPEAMKFLRDVPVTWDETKVQEAKPGKKLIMMRRKGDSWYVGALTDWKPADILFNIPGTGEWLAEIWQDGTNANRNAVDFTYKTELVKSGTIFNAHLASGGGF